MCRDTHSRQKSKYVASNQINVLINLKVAAEHNFTDWFKHAHFYFFWLELHATLLWVLRFDEKLPSNPDDGLFAEASLSTSASRAHLLNPALILLPFCRPLSVCLLCESYHNATKPQALCQDISGRTVTSRRNLFSQQHTDLGQCMKSQHNKEEKKEEW